MKSTSIKQWEIQHMLHLRNFYRESVSYKA